MDNKEIVFTNGCFTILTPRHVGLIRRIREFFSEDKYRLIVGINSNDSSYRLKKYPHIMSNEQRKYIIENIKGVDDVIVFNELTPDKLICKIKPHYIVKGYDYIYKKIEGHKYSNKGIIIIKLDNKLYNINTRNIINSIRC